MSKKPRAKKAQRAPYKGELNKTQRDMLAQAAAGVRSGMTWVYTRDGFKYWHKVAERLEELAKPPAPPTCKCCGQEIKSA